MTRRGKSRRKEYGSPEMYSLRGKAETLGEIIARKDLPEFDQTTQRFYAEQQLHSIDQQINEICTRNKVSVDDLLGAEILALSPELQHAVHILLARIVGYDVLAGSEVAFMAGFRLASACHKWHEDHFLGPDITRGRSDISARRRGGVAAAKKQSTVADEKWRLGATQMIEKMIAENPMIKTIDLANAILEKYPDDAPQSVRLEEWIRETGNKLRQ